MPELNYARLQSPIGVILLVVDAKKLCAVDYEGYEARMFKLLEQRYGQVTLKEVVNPHGFSEKIQAYLEGDFSSIDSIPVAPGGTTFQQEVWQALRTIPVGTTATYGALAAKLGRPAASRAVGYANSLNPIAIVLPCHRVVGANSALTGYAGGLERKQWLLQHEGATLL